MVMEAAADEDEDEEEAGGSSEDEASVLLPPPFSKVEIEVIVNEELKDFFESELEEAVRTISSFFLRL